MSERDSYLEAYRQAFENIRHYSSLRFSLLTAFVVISSGLFTIALQAKELTLQFFFPFIAGLVIAVAFGINELRINKILEFSADRAVELAGYLEIKTDTRPPRNAFWKWCTPVLVLTIYAGSILMWIGALIVIARGSK